MILKNKQILLVIVVILLFCVMVIFSENKVNENFQSNDAMEETLLRKYNRDLRNKSNNELVDLASRLRLRLDSYGLYPDGSGPDMSKFVTKSELNPDLATCTVDKASDREKYILKAGIPEPGPKIDLSKYVLKSSIPPEKVCPPQKEVDYSKYVLKSTLPPQQKCPPCICPKVKVSAGLCKKCPPPPKCPSPAPCPVSKCPEPRPCPDQPQCPNPEPCPAMEEKVRYDVKYIKVPTIITVDQDGNVISENSNMPKKRELNGVEKNSNSKSLNNNVNQETDNEVYNPFETDNNIRKQESGVGGLSNAGSSYSVPQLNTNFKQHGVYGYPFSS